MADTTLPEPKMVSDLPEGTSGSGDGITSERRSDIWKSEIFETYFNGASESLFFMAIGPTDGRLRYEAINPAGLQHTGMTLRQVRGLTPEDVFGVETGSQISHALLQAQQTGRPYRYEPTYRMHLGDRTFESTYSPVWNKSGTMIGIFGSAHDVTDVRRMARLSCESEKMEALGKLACGVAHDFNNLLTGMFGWILALGREASPAKRRALVVEGRRTIERGMSLTERLLAFSRMQSIALQTVDLNDSIRGLEPVLTRALGGIALVSHFAPDLWPATIDCGQIELAVQNLVINARDAMPDGGTMTIETANISLVGAQDDALEPGDYVCVAVSDTGTGMSPDVQRRATEPFFTTKPIGQGTGLGLSMVYGTLHQQGGGVRITSELGKGTTVTLFMPRARPVAGTAPQ